MQSQRLYYRMGFGDGPALGQAFPGSHWIDSCAREYSLATESVKNILEGCGERSDSPDTIAAGSPLWIVRDWLFPTAEKWKSLTSRLASGLFAFHTETALNAIQFLKTLIQQEGLIFETRENCNCWRLYRCFPIYRLYTDNVVGDYLQAHSEFRSGCTVVMQKVHRIVWFGLLSSASNP